MASKPTSKARVSLASVNVLAELERLDISWEAGGGHELKVPCPAHDDSSPSATINAELKVWKCHSAECGESGDFAGFLALWNKVDRRTILADLKTRYDIEVVKSINPQTIEKWHDKIWTSGPLLQALYDRAIDDDLIRQARLGVQDGRITIPVLDASHRCINVRKYLPGAPGPEKMRNTPGYRSLALYQEEDLRFDRVAILGGELKALLAGKLLNPLHIGAVSATAGEGNWDPEWSQKFKDKTVYVLMDVDKGGEVAAKKIAAHLFYYAKAVYIVTLPLDTEKHPKGDINDWVAKEDGNADQLVDLLLNGERFYPPDFEDDEVEEEVHPVSLSRASSQELIAKRLQFEGVVAAIDTTPYYVPKVVGVSCTRDQPNCAICPIRAREPDAETGFVEMTIRGNKPGILEMVGSGKTFQKEAVKDVLRIPECKVVEFSVREYHSAYDVRMTPPMVASGDNKDYVLQSALVVGPSVDLNNTYSFQGSVYPHPRNQQAVFVLDTAEMADDSLAKFAPSDEDLELLRVFQPDEWTVEGIQSKLDEIYEDFEANVTRIYQRRELHLGLDLAWHSVLNFEMDGRTQNGWVNLLVTGDSSQGKSEAVLRIIDHYDLGVRHDCKNATAAGILGGVQQLGQGNRWFVSWGVIPTHDRRLVVLEEIKGMDTTVLGNLTDMRSSGVAELSKIEKRRAHARTRLIMISNPRSDRQITSYNYGVEAVKELVGALEDVRRFDLALILAESQVETGMVNRLMNTRPQVKHKFPRDICKKLVLWGWTRGLEHVRIEDEAYTASVDHATSLTKKYHESLPLVDKGTMRFKLMRLACALAVRTFSVDDDPDIVVVRKCHVDYIRNFIDKLYSDPAFGYEEYSKIRFNLATVKDEEMIRKRLRNVKHPRDTVNSLMQIEAIGINDILILCETDREDAQSLLSFLVRKNALDRCKKSKTEYNKTPDFIRLLKQLRDEGMPVEGGGSTSEF